MQELHSDYPLAPDKIEIKKEMLSDYELKIADLYNIPIGNVKKIVVPNHFDKEKYVVHYENFQLELKLGLNLKKKILCIRIQLITMAIAICWIQQTKKNRSRKNGDKDGKAIYKLMKNAVYGKTIENVRNRIDVKLVSIWASKRKSKMYIQSTHMSHKIFDNDLVLIHKSNFTLTVNKHAYIGMCILELTKVLMYEFHYNYI